jgi:GH24 family phage-related lysozyme (muramidase)
MHLSENGKQFIYAHEGFSPQIYNDIGDNCTIGYGPLVHLNKKNGLDPTERPYLKGITKLQPRNYLLQMLLFMKI